MDQEKIKLELTLKGLMIRELIQPTLGGTKTAYIATIKCMDGPFTDPASILVEERGCKYYKYHCVSNTCMEDAINEVIEKWTLRNSDSY